MGSRKSIRNRSINKNRLLTIWPYRRDAQFFIRALTLAVKPILLRLWSSLPKIIRLDCLGGGYHGSVWSLRKFPTDKLDLKNELGVLDVGTGI